MASFNRVILVGNLTRDVELKYLQSGMAVTELGLAVNDRRKTQSGEWVDETVFVDISLFGRTAEVAGEYLQKGSPVLIEGRLKYDTWEKEGKKHSKLRVVGERMQMLGARQGGAAGSSAVGGSAVGGGGGVAGANANRSANPAPAMSQPAMSRPALGGSVGGSSGGESLGGDSSGGDSSGGESYDGGDDSGGDGGSEQDIPF